MTKSERRTFEDPSKSAFARAFHARRFELGLSQGEAGNQLGVQQQTVHRWESDLGEPQKRIWPALLDFLDIERRELVALLDPDRAEVISMRDRTRATEPIQTEEQREDQAEEQREELRMKLAAAAVAQYEETGEYNDLVAGAARYLGLLR